MYTPSELFHRVPLFGQLDADELDEVLAMTRPVGFEAGDVIVKQGDAADGLYVVADGQVSIRLRVSGDEAVDIAVLGPGEIVGELALLDRGSRTASVYALGPTRAYFLSAARFDALRLGMRPAAQKVMRELMATLCRRIRSQCEEITGKVAAYSIAPQRRRRASLQGSTIGAPYGRGPHIPALPPHVSSKLPLLSELSAPELARFLGACCMWEVPRGHTLYSAGTPVRSCFYVTRGAVQSSLPCNGRSHLLEVHGPGSIVGVMEAIDGGNAICEVVVRESARVLELDCSHSIDRMWSETDLGIHWLDAATRTLITTHRRALHHLSRLAACEGGIPPAAA